MASEHRREGPTHELQDAVQPPSSPTAARRVRVSNTCSSVFAVDRRYELEVLRRSLAMLTPGVRALTREEALDLVEELADVRKRLDQLEEGLRALLADIET